MKRFSFIVALALLTAAWTGCGSSGSDAGNRQDGGGDADADTDTDADADAGGDAGGIPDIADQSFGDFVPWASPIEDYKAVGEENYPGVHDQSINDLVPFEGRLWLSYGDANYNLGGKVPIEFRSFASPDDPEADPAVVDGDGQGATQQTVYQSGEEQIDRYRVLDGSLWQAGIDSIDADEQWTQQSTDPPGIQGNMYRLAGGAWEKHRSIRGGEHVHDLASWDGALFAVGSGADTRLEFEAGQIFRYLWCSKDRGASFETVQRIQHPTPGAGDTRWVHLLALGGGLYLFGYESDFAAGVAYVSNAVFDGTAVQVLEDSALLGTVFGLESLALPDGTGLVVGVDVTESPMRYGIWHVAADGTPARLEALAGFNVVDLAYCPKTEEILYLALTGDEYPGAPTSFEASVQVAPLAAPGSTAELVHCTSDVSPFAIAYWQGRLYLGTGDGQVLRTK